MAVAMELADGNGNDNDNGNYQINNITPRVINYSISN